PWAAGRPGPGLLDDLTTGTTREVGEGRRDEDRVVELSRDRDEVRHEVERYGEVDEQERECDLRPPRHARVAEEPAEQDDAVGDERGRLAGVLPASGDEEREDEGEPDRERRAEPD